MQELNYKIKQLKENWEVFNNRVVKMSVDYEIRLIVPEWFSLDTLCYKDEVFTNLELLTTRTLDDGREEYAFKTQIKSISKCDISKDQFCEETGVYICETRAEIKVLEKVERVIKRLNSIIMSGSNLMLKDLISERIDKNLWNLERLEGEE